MVIRKGTTLDFKRHKKYIYISKIRTKMLIVSITGWWDVRFFSLSLYSLFFYSESIVYSLYNNKTSFKKLIDQVKKVPSIPSLLRVFILNDSVSQMGLLILKPRIKKT